ncbi:sulfurtransferase complex subunit TusB [Kosmotoga sp. DU53]|uniref:sulfurtransferase complex subunit TusB n=1 Tax=Kosmotoga sp. DU53 TaxID=1310160 RepID=UPI0007C5CC50|nr:sulfurtransferase complex subunit TusB [Kosmotoga sp. DU53]MDK2953695.1 hypothetical protein [Kosmotoga sp.]OAA21128.1 hypothetical protein DU53_06565 [Kosmotoga sp. DU53]
MAMILVKYSQGNPISKDVLNLAQPNDEVVLIQDGVLYALGDPKIDELKSKGVKIYALKEDFEVRGYKEDSSVVQLITYDDLIEVIERNEKSIG